jgi:hypothetical protein
VRHHILRDRRKKIEPKLKKDLLVLILAFQDRTKGRMAAMQMGRRLLQDEDTPTVTFPDDYPNSVRHFLLIGFLGMFIGAIVFFYMGISRKVNTVMHVLTFFIAAVSACAYYAEWAGLGVEYKTTDTTPRVIFWAHYLDWVVTGPVRYCCLPLSLLSA